MTTMLSSTYYPPATTTLTANLQTAQTSGAVSIIIPSGTSGNASATASFYPNSATPVAALMQQVPVQAQNLTDTLTGIITIGPILTHHKRSLEGGQEHEDFGLVIH
jgi:hypothetical protein